MAEKELGELVMHDWEFKPTDDNPDLFELVDKETPPIVTGKQIGRAHV